MAVNWQIGYRIQNRWQIYKILKGGMGIVYVVYDHERRDAYAAKTFQDETFFGNPAVAERFTQEALTWVNLDSHENVARALFVQTIEGKPILFLEYVSGGDLSGWINTPRLTEDLPQVLRFAIQFCDGMSHALSKGVTAHRDIKPANCLVTANGTLKVTDFGLARAVAIQAGKGGRGGTPEYMPPEQWSNFEQADQRADIYSFGAMLYEMLTGQPPFGKRRERDGRDLELRHNGDSPPPLNSQHSILNSIVQTCLVKDPARRYREFGEVRVGLAALYERVTGTKAAEAARGAALSAGQRNNKGVSLYELGRLEEAIACYDLALALDPLYAEAWDNKGNALGGLGRLEEALACCDHALEINPRAAPGWNNKGITLHDLGRSEEALACYDHALQINPRFEQAWFNKGRALHDLGRSEEGLACYDHALQIEPRFEQAWSNKGIALSRMGLVEEALACYDHALEINPRSAEAWYDKGVALYRLGRSQEALACYDQALALNPRLEQAWNNKGAILNRLQRSLEALACYQHALEINPSYAEAWCNQGVMLFGVGRIEEAVACFDRAIEINPHYAEPCYNKGIALVNLGQTEEGLACFERAIAINPHYADALYNKGVVLFSVGRTEEGTACFEEAHRLGHPQAAQTIALWREMLGR